MRAAAEDDRKLKPLNNSQLKFKLSFSKFITAKDIFMAKNK